MTIDRDVFELVNNYRRQNGRAPLQWDSGISYLCYIHSRNMANGAVPFGHYGVDDRYNRLPFYSIQSAENVAYNYINDPNLAQTVVIQWINSYGHRKNMLGNYNRSAIGVAQSSDGRVYFTQLFGCEQDY